MQSNTLLFRANASAAFASDEAVEAHPYAYELDHDECPEEQLKSTEPQVR